jgi:protein phosphatase PTC7
MGDAGYALFHVDILTNKLEMYYRSQEQQKVFNHPYQVGTHDMADNPDVAVVVEHKDIQQNDLIMLYTDGFSDNVPTEEFSSCLEASLSHLGGVKSFSQMANCQARKAYVLGKDQHYDSPFAKNARKSKLKHMGGKHDDISIIVAQFQVDGAIKNQYFYNYDQELFHEDKYIYKVHEDIMSK